MKNFSVDEQVIFVSENSTHEDSCIRYSYYNNPGFATPPIPSVASFSIIPPTDSIVPAPLSFGAPILFLNLTLSLPPPPRPPVTDFYVCYGFSFFFFFI